MLESLCTMVSVVKWLRRQVVALEIEGSNPFAHPTASQTPLACPAKQADETWGVQSRTVGIAGPSSEGMRAFRDQSLL